MRRARLLLVPGVLVALAALAGCSTKNALLPDTPPETGVFVQGQVDTVNHVVELFWFGNDADGIVVGFELRFRNPAAAADTAWTFTTRTDSLFTIYTPAGFTAPIFEVRAVDDEGQRDPSPATANFSFSNRPPVVVITGAPGPGDSTYASATIDWSTVDPDGDLSRVVYRFWLDGQDSTAAPFVTGRRYTIPSQNFLDGGVFRGGTRTAFIKPIDDGGMAGATASTSWYVRETSPNARLLIVDDLPSSNALNQSSDQLYTDAVAGAGLAADEWSVLRLEFNKSFRSVRDLEQTFALFDAVIWYRGDQSGASSSTPDPLRDLQEGIATYVESGGRVMLEGRNLFRSTEVTGVTSGSIDPAMATRLFGSDGLAQHPPTGGTNDSPVVWGINGGRVLKSSMWPDTLRFQAARSGLHCFEVRDTGNVAFWARKGVLSQNNTVDLPVAVDVPHPSGGRAIVFAFPLRIANVTGSAPAVLDRVFHDLGLRP